MNSWQVSRQIQYLLLNQDWTGGSNDVFGAGSVIVTAGLPEQFSSTLRYPCAIITPGAAQPDPYGEEPDIIIQPFTVRLIAIAPGDQSGQKSLIGGNVPDRTASEGRGLLECEEELIKAVGMLTNGAGVAIANLAAGAVQPALDANRRYITWRDYTFNAYCTTQRYYHPPTGFTATDATGGDASLSWQLPPDRFDRYEIVVRRASGSQAPGLPTQGTAVTLASVLATSVTDSPGAGTFSYSIWAGFDESGAATLASSDNYSKLEAYTQRTVTVT